MAGLPTTAGCPAFAYEPEPTAHRSSPASRRRAPSWSARPTSTSSPPAWSAPAPPTAPCESPRGARAASAGGSSSGSAVAVATGEADLALGTDTAGSGRVPAALCGVVGLKPTRGWLSTRGVVPACRSLDCVSRVRRRPWPRAAAADRGGGRLRRRRPVVAAAPAGGARGRSRRLGRPEPRRCCDATCDPEVAEAFARPRPGAALRGRRGRPRAVPGGGRPPVRRGLRRRAPRRRRRLRRRPPRRRRPRRAARSSSRRPRSRPTASPPTGTPRRPAPRADAAVGRRSTRIVVPTAPATRPSPRSPPIPLGTNTALGRFTNGANLLDWCAAAVPVGRRRRRAARSASACSGPAWTDRAMWAAAAALAGRPRARRRASDDGWLLAVCGAHLEGQPLHHQLDATGAPAWSPAPPPRPATACTALATEPAQARAGARADRGRAPRSRWRCGRSTPRAFGTFVAAVPAPLTIGTVELADGTAVKGFLCEPHATGRHHRHHRRRRLARVAGPLGDHRGRRAGLVHHGAGPPGRLGYWMVGVPPSGPMDDLSFRLANRAVGNRRRRRRPRVHGQRAPRSGSPSPPSCAWAARDMGADARRPPGALLAAVRGRRRRGAAARPPHRARPAHLRRGAGRPRRARGARQPLHLHPRRLRRPRRPRARGGRRAARRRRHVASCRRRRCPRLLARDHAPLAHRRAGGPARRARVLHRRRRRRPLRRRVAGAGPLRPHRGAPRRPEADVGPPRRRRGRAPPVQHPRHRLRLRHGRLHRRHAGACSAPTARASAGSPAPPPSSPPSAGSSASWRPATTSRFVPISAERAAEPARRRTRHGRARLRPGGRLRRCRRRRDPAGGVLARTPGDGADRPDHADPPLRRRLRARRVRRRCPSTSPSAPGSTPSTRWLAAEHGRGADRRRHARACARLLVQVDPSAVDGRRRWPTLLQKGDDELPRRPRRSPSTPARSTSRCRGRTPRPSRRSAGTWRSCATTRRGARPTSSSSAGSTGSTPSTTCTGSCSTRRYLVLGLGDVYLGAPVATPLDPRHRLVTTKYNPARTWTPENAVGIGGAYLCVYGMEGPGGYQFVGRTVPVWYLDVPTPGRRARRAVAPAVLRPDPLPPRRRRRAARPAGPGQGRRARPGDRADDVPPRRPPRLPRGRGRRHRRVPRRPAGGLRGRARPLAPHRRALTPRPRRAGSPGPPRAADRAAGRAGSVEQRSAARPRRGGRPAPRAVVARRVRAEPVLGRLVAGQQRAGGEPRVDGAQLAARLPLRAPAPRPPSSRRRRSCQYALEVRGGALGQAVDLVDVEGEPAEREHVLAHQPEEALGHGPGRRPLPFDDGQRDAVHPLEDRAEDLGLRPEPVVDRRLLQPGALGDLGHGHRLHAVGREQRAGRGHDALAGVVRPPGGDGCGAGLGGAARRRRHGPRRDPTPPRARPAGVRRASAPVHERRFSMDIRPERHLLTVAACAPDTSLAC